MTNFRFIVWHLRFSHACNVTSDTHMGIVTSLYHEQLTLLITDSYTLATDSYELPARVFRSMILTNSVQPVTIKLLYYIITTIYSCNDVSGDQEHKFRTTSYFSCLLTDNSRLDRILL